MQCGNFPRGRGFGRGMGRGFALACQGQCPICPAYPFLNQNQKQPTKKEQKQFLQEELKRLLLKSDQLN